MLSERTQTKPTLSFDEYKAIVDEAKESISSNETRKVREKLESAIAAYPEIADAIVARADMAFHQAQEEKEEKLYRNALADYDLALTLLPVNIATLIKRAKTHQKLNNTTGFTADLKTRATLVKTENGFREEYHKHLRRYLLATDQNNSQYAKLLAANPEELITDDSLSYNAALLTYYAQSYLGDNIANHYYYHCAQRSAPLDMIAATNALIPSPKKDKQKTRKQLDLIINQYGYGKAYLYRGVLSLDEEGLLSQIKADFRQFLILMDNLDEAEAHVAYQKIMKVMSGHEKMAQHHTSGLMFYENEDYEEAAVEFALALLQSKSKYLLLDVSKITPEVMQSIHEYQFLHDIAACMAQLIAGNYAEAKFFLDASLAYPQFSNHEFYDNIFKKCQQTGNKLFSEGYFQSAASALGTVISLKCPAEFLFDYAKALHKAGKPEEATRIFDHAINQLSAKVLRPFKVEYKSINKSEYVAEKDNQRNEIYELQEGLFRHMPAFDLSACSMDEKSIQTEKEEYAAYLKKEKQYHDLIHVSTPSADGKATKKQISSAKQATILFPEFPDGYWVQAKQLWFSGNLHESEALCKKVLEIDPQSFIVFELLSLIAKKHDIKASELYRKKMTMTVELYDYYQKACFNIIVKNAGEVRLSHETQKRIFKDTYTALMGQVAFNRNQFKLAIHHYTQYLLDSPENFIVLTERALAQFALKKFHLALDDINKALEFCQYPRAYWLRSIIYAKQGEWDLAKSDMEQCFANACAEDHPFYALSKEAIFYILGQAKTTETFITLAQKLFFVGKLKKAEAYVSAAICLGADQDVLIYLGYRAIIHIHSTNTFAGMLDMISLVNTNKLRKLISDETIEQIKNNFVNAALEYKAIPRANLTYMQTFALINAAYIKPGKELLTKLAEALPHFEILLIDEFLNRTKNPTLFTMDVSRYTTILTYIKDFLLHFKPSADAKADEKTIYEALESIFAGVYITHEMQLKLAHKKKLAEAKLLAESAPKAPKKHKQPMPKAYVADDKTEINALAMQYEQEEKLRLEQKTTADKIRKEDNKAKLKAQKLEQRLIRKQKYKLFSEMNISTSDPGEEKHHEEKIEKPNYKAITTEIDFNFSSLKSQTGTRYSIQLLAIEKDIIERLNLYYQATAETTITPKLTYFVGGSIQDRLRNAIYNRPTVIKPGTEYDTDLVTEYDEATLYKILATFNPYKPPNTENLLQIRCQDSTGMIVRVDIRYGKDLSVMKADARKRLIGYFYADANGQVESPLGYRVIKDLLQSRLTCNYPLETAFHGEMKEGQTVETMPLEECQAPARILLYIYHNTKRQLELADNLKRQMKKDAPLLLRERITAGFLNAKLKKLLTNGYAQKNLELLYQFGVLDELFPFIKRSIKHDLPWLLVQMDATDRLQKYRSIKHVYATLIVSAACQQEGIINHPDPESRRFVVGVKCNAIINESRYFKDVFTDKNFNSIHLFNKLISYWMYEHGLTKSLIREEEPTVHLLYQPRPMRS